MRQRIGCLAVLAITAAGCFGFWLAGRHEAQLNANFARVRIGMTEAEAAAILGKPKWRGRCGTSDYYSFVTPISGSTVCLIYASAFAPLNPWYPVIFLGGNGRVIDKYTYASP